MNWDEYFMRFARHASLKSKDTTKVGAILVDPDGAVILTGFNGPPKGVRDLPERFVRPEKYQYASHAEQNLIAFAARRGIMTKDCKVYCTHMPCANCTKTLIQAGVKEIVHGSGTFQALEEDRKAVQFMCQEVGIDLREFPGEDEIDF